jgi:hypothetical protein
MMDDDDDDDDDDNNDNQYRTRKNSIRLGTMIAS